MPDYRNAGLAGTTQKAYPQDPTSNNTAIRDQVNTYESLVGTLHEAIELLERRLDTALASVPPSTAGVEAPAAQAGSSFVYGLIAENNRRLGSAISRIHELTNRVEI